jgi:hypothetical protein
VTIFFQLHCPRQNNGLFIVFIMFASHDLRVDTFDRFVFDGLGLLMESLLISTASNIQKINVDGTRKISRNMLALQQCVKSISRDGRDTEFVRAKEYWALYSMNPAVSFTLSLDHTSVNAFATYRICSIIFVAIKFSPLTSTKSCWISNVELIVVSENNPPQRRQTGTIACM